MHKIIEIMVFVDFVEKIICNKIRGHCHLIAKYRGPPHNTCTIIVTQDQSNLIPFIIHSFIIMIVICFLKN